VATPLSKLLQRRRALAAKRAEIDAQLAKLDTEIFPRVETLASAFEGAKPGALLTVERVALLPARQRPKAIIGEVEKVLREANRPMKTGEIYEELRRRGIEVPGKVPQNNLSAHLSHHSQIFAASPVGWRLRQEVFVDQEKPNAHAQH
jgi:hypothetical protein